ncbi:MAG: NTP transferase domain-containing protein [Promethearchaeota archaeon]
MEKTSNIHTSITVIVLCAGEGTRMGKLTHAVPKPLLKIRALNHKPILQYIIENLRRCGIANIIVVTGHLSEKIEHFIRNFDENIVIVNLKNEYKKGPLDSFLSGLRALKFKKNRSLSEKNPVYVVIPGDTLFDVKLFEEAFTLIQEIYSEKQLKPTIFYRKISLELFVAQKRRRDFPLIISTAIIKSDDDKSFLEKIEQKIIKPSSFQGKEISQVVPIFAFPDVVINPIFHLENLVAERSLKALINRYALEVSEVLAVKINAQQGFFDIDEKEDLNFDGLKDII